jgi:hypothetical protein
MVEALLLTESWQKAPDGYNEEETGEGGGNSEGRVAKQPWAYQTSPENLKGSQTSAFFDVITGPWKRGHVHVESFAGTSY